ncbi:MAG: hypothetical protein IT305_23975 [Chloroflexi bacterium]|nr:hypothetical protein [Chloroflexota bacterium]
MPRFSDVLSPEARLALAVRTQSPYQLALAFAAHAGQFYDRTSFDHLARQVSDLYARRDGGNASEFRRRLDRRLCDRYHQPVAWDVAPSDRDGAA